MIINKKFLSYPFFVCLFCASLSIGLQSASAQDIHAFNRFQYHSYSWKALHTEAFHVFFEQGKRLPTGGYDVAHDTHVFAVDEDDEVSVVWNSETTGAEFATDIHTLLDS